MKTIFTIAAEINARKEAIQQEEKRQQDAIKQQKDNELLERFTARFETLLGVINDSGIIYDADGEDKCIVFKRDDDVVKMDFHTGVSWRPEYQDRDDGIWYYTFGNYTDEDLILYLDRAFRLKEENRVAKTLLPSDY